MPTMKPAHRRDARNSPDRILHTMLRVTNLDRSLEFYVGHLGMKLLRREEYPQGRFTLAFVGYECEATGPAIELTHNWDRRTYELGSAYGHIALAVADLKTTCRALEEAGVRIVRPPGPMSSVSPDRVDPEVIAFVEDPDGYVLELIERREGGPM
jgi:lactoylglutathione lyase